MAHTNYNTATILRRLCSATILLITFGLLTTCALPREEAYPIPKGQRIVYTDEEKSSVFGSEGLMLFGGKGVKDESGVSGGGIGVNSFLWRASLDTLSFMPLASADPFGGVIITDWYSPPQTPNERFKMAVYILDRRLRADGLRVAIFRQLRSDTREWESTTVDSSTRIGLENTILTRARQLRIAALPE